MDQSDKMIQFLDAVRHDEAASYVQGHCVHYPHFAPMAHFNDDAG